jgi:hypothetical protein
MSTLREALAQYVTVRRVYVFSKSATKEVGF